MARELQKGAWEADGDLQALELEFTKEEIKKAIWNLELDRG